MFDLMGGNPYSITIINIVCNLPLKTLKDVYKLLKTDNVDESLRDEGIRNNISLQASSATVITLLQDAKQD